MGHDEGAHQTGRNAPRGGPYVFELAFLVDVLHVERLGEVLPEEVRRAALQGLAVLHQRFDRERILGAGEAFVGRLVTHDHRHGHPLLREFLVDVDHLCGLLDRLFVRGMGRVALLPEELGRAQEKARAHLPAHHVGPLVAEDRQVAVRLDPVLIGVPDDRLRGGAYDQLLFELGIGIDHDPFALGVVFQTVVRHHGALFGEALDVVGFLGEERLGYEKREVGVLVPRLLEHRVQRVVHLLPDGVAVGFDDHAAAYGRVLGQPRLYDQVVVPLRVVVVRLGQVLEFLCHSACVFSCRKIRKFNS